MKKEEEEKFDEEFTNNFCDTDIIGNDLFNDLKIWITEHDQRERDRLYDGISKMFN